MIIDLEHHLEPREILGEAHGQVCGFPGSEILESLDKKSIDGMLGTNAVELLDLEV
jgi:hypothetical protein